MMKTTKFMKQSGSQDDSERRHNGSHRLEASRKVRVGAREREGEMDEGGQTGRQAGRLAGRKEGMNCACALKRPG